MGKIYVISDTHFNHKNIIEYCNRPFKTVEEMNEVLIKNWNDVVSQEDTIICLGDFVLGTKENIIEIGTKLNGHKILILGNHDRGTKLAYKEAGFETVYGEHAIIDFGKDIGIIEFSHHRKDDSHYRNLYGHQHDKPLDDESHRCVCVELYNYKPILLEDAIENLKEPEDKN